MDLKVQTKVIEHLYHVVMQKPFKTNVPFTPQKKRYTETTIRDPLPRKTAESLGFSSAYLGEFLQELGQTKNLNVHQVMVVQNGAVISEAAFAPFQLKLWHVTHSLCKTVTAMAVGLLVGEGKLSPEDKLIRLFDKQMSPIAKFKLAKLEVRHLLTMTSGIGVNETLLCAEEDWLAACLDTSLHFEPGSKFFYNSINSYLLSCIVEEIAGVPMFDFLKQRLFTPLGIETVQWECCPKGHTKGGWGMYLLPEDMAKLGLLLLQKGNWNGQRLLSSEYITEMTRKQVESAPEEDMYGYGFQTWMGKVEGTFLFNGMLGQNVHVLPHKNLVVVVTGGNDRLFGDCQVNEIIEKYFYDNDIPVPTADKFASRKLRAIEKRLKSEFGFLPPPKGIRLLKTAIPPPVADLVGNSYHFAKKQVRLQPLFAQFLNNSYTEGIGELAFSLENERILLTVTEGELVNRFPIGFEEPLYGEVHFGGETYLVAAQGYFTKDEDETPVFKIVIPFVEHSNGRIIKIFFLDGKNIRVEWSEFPGRGVLNNGVETLLAGMGDTVLTQLKAHVDLDLMLTLADGLIEPVSFGALQ